MQIEKGSLLLGFVFGLAVATILMAGSVVLASRDGGVPTRATASIGLNPSASATPASVRSSPIPSLLSTPTTTAVPTRTPTATPQPPTLQYETVEVPARKFTVLQVQAEPGQTLELTVTVDSDVDLTLFAPDGSPVEGPVRVRRTQSLRRYSEAGGNWGIKLDNSYSWITNKQVLIQYRLFPGR